MDVRHSPPPTDFALALFKAVCRAAGSRTLIDDLRRGLSRAGLVAAVRDHDNDRLFDWLVEAISYQGVSDAVAGAYMNAHGRVAAFDVATGLAAGPSCPKLTSYWQFESCGYHKGSGTCSEPDHARCCPVPSHDLRNGRLNQSAYATYLFFRDVTSHDLVGWIDRQLESASAAGGAGGGRRAALRQSLLGPMGQIYGVSNKVLSMALASLLLGADPGRPLWVETGASMIAIDTLVHNWLHRTGILAGLGCEHPYGPRCYGPNGCAGIIEAMSVRIDARQFNPDYPADFPRFVQKAIWWFCAQAGLNECNGNRVDDRAACGRDDCPIGALCARQPLRRAD